MEAIIPTKSKIPTSRTEVASDSQNDEAICHELDTLDEKRDTTRLRLASYQQSVSRHYNRHVHTQTFKLGNWVLRCVFQNTKEIGVGKLGPTWEGSYLITKLFGNDAYKLQDKDGRDIGNILSRPSRNYIGLDPVKGYVGNSTEHSSMEHSPA
ncbi:uncharacterized protein LOC131022994 [Salvia miltiorrhiza]|uniref:uncharacterized protein LOC131022994 n=1 Tax=Salvia miltiorrhiza TaxID=226208 RepID=UPI0025AB6876|nr:uncharacterized protein LOC131022994 [Salvia miltiorrhiza]